MPDAYSGLQFYASYVGAILVIALVLCNARIKRLASGEGAIRRTNHRLWVITPLS